jgi:hypothetical protein
VDGVVALLAEDVLFTMPPLPFEWLGREPAGLFLSAMWAALGSPPRLVATRANGQPAFALDGGTHGSLGLLVLSLAGARISAITRFDAALLPSFGL